MKYCWDHVDDMIAYRLSLGYSLQPMKWYLLDFSRFLLDEYPTEEKITLEMIMPWCVRRSTEQVCSFRRRISAVRQYTKYLFAMDICDFILSTDFIPADKRYTPYIFSDKELCLLFEKADKKIDLSIISTKDQIISVIYRLIYFCGLRPNEGRELMKTDIDLLNGTLLIRKNKTHKERIIPMPDDVTEMMRSHFQKMSVLYPETDFVFPSPTGNPYKSKWLRLEFLKLWNEIKLPGNTAHVRVYDLRHRWATTVMMKFLNEGKDLYAVLPYMSAYMGHAHFEDTAYYIHLLPEKLIKSSAIDWSKLTALIPEVPEDE